MARMLSKTARRHASQPCRHAGRGCTCYLFREATTTDRQLGKLRARQRRRARAIEKRDWSRAATR
ncbi:hypothetical protein ABR738_00625 [Streptomyces sp. Edi4]|uniref:hypothetical protein n=1 Tax=Streptomyces sp. Edi4 TaxID=3162527 RepID=UPI003305A8B1